MFEKFTNSFNKINIKPILFTSKSNHSLLFLLIKIILKKIFFIDKIYIRLIFLFNKNIRFCYVQNLYPNFDKNILNYLIKKNVIVFFRISNYRLICPNSYMYRENKICTECMNGKISNVIKYNCENNFIKSIFSYFRTRDLNLIKNLSNINFIVQTKYQKEFFSNLHNYKLNKFFIIHNFVQKNLEMKKIIIPFKKFFLLSGRNHESKGFEQIIQFFMKNKKHNLIVTSKQNISNISDNIKFVGYLTQNENFYLISKAQGIIFNSQWLDVCPNIILETMALKKIIISNYVDSLKEILIPNKTCLNFHDEKTFKTQLELVANKKFDKNIVHNAKDMILNYFSEEQFIYSLKKIFNNSN